MKNVTKILTAVVLCAAVFASTQRVESLGGNAAFWPGDEANIGAFPAQINNHGFVQLTGVASGDATNPGAHMVFDHNGTAWGLSFADSDDQWVDLGWGNGTMGISVGIMNSTDDTGADMTGYEFSYGNTFDWGELGFHYNSGDGVTEGIEVDYRKACGWWVFTDMVANLNMPDDDDMDLTVDWFTHWDASGADVLFAMGMTYDEASGALDQTAAVAVEANMTDWATFRAGVNWDYQLSGDDDVVGHGDFGWSTGLGFNWGGFTADFTIDDDLLRDPVGTMTGNNHDGGGLAKTDTAITLSYSF